MIKCQRVDCLWNSKENKISGICQRDEILIDSWKELWVCKCFSQEKISGHMDFFRLLKPDGTPKGGAIDDEHAKKMHEESLKSKSFKTHLKQGKEKKK